MTTATSLISADNEWSPLKAVIVGRAEHSCFPSEPARMIEATMPSEHWPEFKPGNPFSADIVAKAKQELDNLASLLEKEGVKVYRPNKVDWLKNGGYTGAMPRDGLLTVGNTLIEAPFAWACRRNEIRLGYSDILDELNGSRGQARICRAPTIIGPDTLIPSNSKDNISNGTEDSVWAINDSRPAFDAADFMRFGKTIIGQLSHVTNRKGFAYLQAMLPSGYTVETLATTDEHAMHIDATILPLRKGLLVYSPHRVTEAELRRHDVFRDWALHAYPFTPEPRTNPPMYMCSPWLVLNALSLDEKRIVVEEKDARFADWVRGEFGMEPILIPFQHVHSLGGSFHCATVDLVRE